MAEEVAGQRVFLVSAAASYINGYAIAVDGSLGWIRKCFAISLF